MVELLRFQSTRFDPAAEEPNPINPIAGHAVLGWLCGELREQGFDASAPAPEDWGWFSYIEAGGARHLLGVSGEAGGSEPIEWCIQIHRQRSLWDRLRGANRLCRGSSVVVAVAELLRAQPDFARVEQESED